MSTPKAEKTERLLPEDIIPGDPVATLARLCARNGWAFVYDFSGGAPFVDPRCAAALCNPKAEYKTAQNSILDNVQRYTGGLVRMPDVMRAKGKSAAE